MSQKRNDDKQAVNVGLAEKVKGLYDSYHDEDHLAVVYFETPQFFTTRIMESAGVPLEILKPIGMTYHLPLTYMVCY